MNTFKKSPVTHGNEIQGQENTIHFYSIIKMDYTQSLRGDCI